jgi:hypothetical protein
VSRLLHLAKLGSKPQPATPLDIVRKLSPFPVRRYTAAFAARQQGLCQIRCRKDFRASAFALFPERHGFPHGISLVIQSPCLDGLPNERYLNGSQMYFHTPYA